MTALPSADDRTADSAFERLLVAEQVANAQRLNLLRLVGGTVFLALEWIPGLVGARHMVGLPSLLLLAYVIMSLALVLLARRFAPAAHASRLAIPFLDMPFIYCIQHLNLVQSDAPRAVGNFTLAIFISAILLATLSLERWQIIMAAVVAVVLQLTIHWQAGETYYGMIGGTFLLLSVTLLCNFARRRQMEMVWALCGEQLRRERLGRYFSPLVAEEIEKADEGMSRAQLCEVTVLFSDLREFTTLAEQLDTADIVTLLNDYFEHMVAVVFEHGGTLDKYIGDGLMIYFGAPVTQEDHATRAVRCALAMQKSLTAFNEARADQLPLRMGIGVHTGTAVVGSIGALHRREYTAIGDTVNLAARIEQLCKTYQEDVLVSSTTQQQVGAAAKFRQITECQVKGRMAPVQVFAPT